MLWFKLARGAALATAAGSTLLLIWSLASGPSLGWLGASLAWLSVLGAAALAAAVGIGRLDELRGERRAQLLADYDRRLAERTRAAAALTHAPNGSPELVAALTRDVAAQLGSLPLDVAVAPPRHWGRMSALGLGVALVAFFWLTRSEHAASGLYALIHPAHSDDHGTAIGLWVSRVSAEVQLPDQNGGETTTLIDPARIEVPEGTLLTLRVTPRFDVERALLKVGDQSLPMRPDKNGTLRAVLTAEVSGALALSARIRDTWVRDSVARTLVVAQDQAPVVELDSPLADLSAAPDEPVPFVYRASDDHGLGTLDLVVQLGPGRERRVHLASFDESTDSTRYASSTEVIPDAFGARPGQTLAVWIEARDRDKYGGANVGRSPVRTITVGAEHEPGGAPVELLERTRDQSVDVLGERLESPLPARSDAKARERRLARSTRNLVKSLETLARAYEEGTRDDATAGLVRDMARRLSKLMREEAAAAESASERDLRRVDDASVAELEDDVLWLSDLIGRARLSNAEHSLERLAATRARMRDLLKQLRKSQDPQRKAELMAEIARARAELAELASKLSQASHAVPGDFVNYEALKAKASEDPLRDLEEALARGDMDAAEKAMAALDQQIDGLESGLSEGSEAFASARFGPRNAAAERARAEINELERAQKQLANETGRIAGQARAQRSQSGEFKAQTERLAGEAEGLEQRTRALEAGRMQSAVSEAQASAAQRLRDARDALRQGDTQEARAMAQRAADDLGGLASELALDARMFPGSDGSRFEEARKASQLARDVSRFAEQIGDSLPQDRGPLAPDEGEALRKQAPSQRNIGDKAGKLAQELRDQGPPSMSDQLQRATRAMREAADALERGSLPEAQANQREALEKLAELSDELQRQQRASGGGGGGQEGGDGGRRTTSDQKVAIPQQGDEARRAELRRRVLDARRAQTPDAFERSVERYYQEILR